MKWHPARRKCLAGTDRCPSSRENLQYYRPLASVQEQFLFLFVISSASVRLLKYDLLTSERNLSKSSHGFRSLEDMRQNRLPTKIASLQYRAAIRPPKKLFDEKPGSGADLVCTARHSIDRRSIRCGMKCHLMRGKNAFRSRLDAQQEREN